MSVAWYGLVGSVPALLALGFVASSYRTNKLGRWVHAPGSFSDERRISRKLRGTWGTKTVLRHKSENSESVSSIYKELASWAGKVHLLETDEHLLVMFPSGELYISTSVIAGLSFDKLA